MNAFTPRGRSPSRLLDLLRPPRPCRCALPELRGRDLLDSTHVRHLRFFGEIISFEQNCSLQTPFPRYQNTPVVSPEY